MPTDARASAASAERDDDSGATLAALVADVAAAAAPAAPPDAASRARDALLRALSRESAPSALAALDCAQLPRVPAALFATLRAAVDARHGTARDALVDALVRANALDSAVDALLADADADADAQRAAAAWLAALAGDEAAAVADRVLRSAALARLAAAATADVRGVVRLRALELGVRVLARSEAAATRVLASPLAPLVGSLAALLARTDDALLRLSALELAVPLCVGAPHGVRYAAAHGVLPLLRDAVLRRTARNERALASDADNAGAGADDDDDSGFESMFVSNAVRCLRSIVVDDAYAAAALDERSLERNALLRSIAALCESEYDDDDVLTSCVVTLTTFVAAGLGGADELRLLTDLFSDRVAAFVGQASKRALAAASLFALASLLHRLQREQMDARAFVARLRTAQRPLLEYMRTHTLTHNSHEKTELRCAAFRFVQALTYAPWGAAAVLGNVHWFALLLDRDAELVQDTRVVKYELVQTLLMHENARECGAVSAEQWAQLRKFVAQGVHFVRGVPIPDVAY